MTVATLRTTYLNLYLARADSDTQPWAAATCDRAIGDALASLWPTVGLFATGDTPTSEANLADVPSALGTALGQYAISRIDLLDSSGRYVDKVTDFRQHDGGHVVIKPRLSAGYTLRFYGWKPFALDASDLPTRLEPVVCMKAAALACGDLAGALVNFQRQQALDSARVVSYQEAVALSAYWERRYADAIARDPARVSLAPRRAYR